MGVYIKDMEMPESCKNCQWVEEYGGDYDWCYACRHTGKMPLENAEDGRDTDCPLVEVKAPHGRLIDADEIKPNLYDPRLEAINNGKATYYANMEQIHNAPTVLEAERNVGN